MGNRQAIGAGLGASEIAAALGVHPHKARLDLWLEKTGQAAPFEGNERTAWGLDVEPALRQWYADRCGRPIVVPRESLYHAEVPWLRATPDGLVLEEADAEVSLDLSPVAALDAGLVSHGFEAKNVGRHSAHRWGAPGTDEVPIEYLFQAQQNMAVTGLSRWVLVPCLAGDPPTEYVVERDDELIAEAIDGARAFWHLVEARELPPVDGSDAWADFLVERYPFARDDYVKASAEDEDRVARLREVRVALRDLEVQRAQLENELKVSIGACAGLETAVGRITWKPARPRTIVDWESIAVNIAAERGVTDVEMLARVRAHTRESKASRPFTVPRSWAKES